MNGDGYPTEEELARVSSWPSEDIKGVFAFMKSMWWGAEMGYWHEESFFPEHGRFYKISTAGWSGNEDIIEALRANQVLWQSCWYSERRGGHFEFRVKA